MNSSKMLRHLWLRPAARIISWKMWKNVQNVRLDALFPNIYLLLVLACKLVELMSFKVSGPGCGCLPPTAIFQRLGTAQIISWKMWKNVQNVRLDALIPNIYLLLVLACKLAE